MATIQSVINDLEALLASLKLKLNDEMGIAVPVAEPVEVVVYATPIEDLPIVKKEVNWLDLPDDILTYIGKFFDVKKMEAQERFDRFVVIINTKRVADAETRWKKYGKPTKKGITFNEQGQNEFGQKTLSLTKEYPLWYYRHFNCNYTYKLKKMKERYEKKYWIHQTAFKTLGDDYGENYGNEEWKFAEEYPEGIDFERRFPKAQGNDGYATRCFAPLNLVEGMYMYGDSKYKYHY